MSTRNMSWSVVAAVAATVGLGVPTAGWAQCVPEWSALGSGMNNHVYALAVFDDDGAGPNRAALYAGGTFTTAGGVSANYIAKWDGTTWSALGAGMNDGVYALTVFDDDGGGPNPPALYAGGSFTTAGGVNANYIAKWNGVSWSALGDGMTGAGYWPGVYALTGFDGDGPGPNAAQLHVGGAFTAAGGVSANYIAKWDGTNWSALGSGMAGGEPCEVLALTAFDDDGAGPNPAALYAGGGFTMAGGVSANGVAKWHAATWWPLASGMNVGVNALSTFDDDGAGPNQEALYAGGGFTTAGGVSANRIAKWDGTDWSPLGNGMNQRVRALVVFDDDLAGPSPLALYAGGNFATAGGVSASHIAKWDGATWSALGTGLSGSGNYPGVYALTVFDDDGAGPNPPALYAGGWYSTAGGVSANNIARWRCPFNKGDLNCDGRMDAFDIDPFVLAITNPPAYQAAYPNCNVWLADMNCDGWINAFDIDPFVKCLTTGDCDCP